MSRPEPKETRTCMTCGSEFQFRNTPSKAASGRGKYCSVGCGTKANSTKHGHATDSGESPTYVSYRAMLDRCYREKNAKYSSYGGSGISVCDRWRVSFENFLADMGERPKGTSIDRINGLGNYEPGNCRWATAKDQQHNIKSNHMISFGGKTMCISDWSRETGIPTASLYYRLKAGWSESDMLMIQPRLGNRIPAAK